jgi:hypothetical protein
VPPGESVSFTRSCGELQAIVIDDANLITVGQHVSPDTDSEVLRNGVEFACGKFIFFNFVHTDLLGDFALQIAVSDYPTAAPQSQ